MPRPVLMTPPLPAYAGLELISAAVLVADARRTLVFMNTAAEDLFAVSCKSVAGQALQRLLPASPAGNQALFQLLATAVTEDKTVSGSELQLETAAGGHLHCAVAVSPLDDGRVVIELAARDQAWRIAREERILERQELNRELLRNLAHEIKNPLGGIRGAAQLLARELASVPSDASLQEYTDVIVKEADRLQALMDRLLTPHRRLKFERINVHEVVERVRTLLLAEFPSGLNVLRDYDASLPDFIADRETLIQAILNIARNAAQALAGHGQIRLITRIARQVTLAKRRYRHAIVVQVVDNGPGVPPDLAGKIFFPLVTGRAGGTGLGLSLAQQLVNQHQGLIEFESEPGRTCFTVVLPMREMDAIAQAPAPSDAQLRAFH
ncbi:MAG: PAS domain-containing protein [Betaproteobacteria bacterium]|nr:PAS domain-containing protein [Betaproteobacteria bacterium]